MSRIVILGAGAWGTALAVCFSESHKVVLWSIDADQVALMRETRCNTQYLPDIALPVTLELTADFSAAVQGADLLIVATPVSAMRETLHRVVEAASDAPLLWVCKGFESKSSKLPHQIASDVLPAGQAFGVLTGPSFAQEVAAGMPCAITLAATDLGFAQDWARRLATPRLRLYANDDLVGAEIGGAVKNVLAIAAGISDGLGFGLNARAALITRGLAEIARLCQALGGRRESLMGLAGVGDLILTCTGDLSRNRRVGLALARGESLADILRQLGHVAEGVNSTQVAARLAQELGVDMPITRAVNDVLAGRIAPRSAVEQLMSRDPKTE